MCYRSASVPVRHVPKSVQTQAPPDRAQAPAQRREAVSVPKMFETLLALWLLQPTHESSLLLLPTLSGKLLEKQPPNYSRKMKWRIQEMLIVSKQKQRIVINEWGRACRPFKTICLFSKYIALF